MPSVVEQIKVANISYEPLTIFGGLRDFPGVQYEENTPTENARRLHEGEVDVALIPSSEFALHGAYIGLDFGVGFKGRCNFINLFAHQDISKLDAIYLYDSSGASSLLLRLLLRSKWKATPRLIRTRREFDPNSLTEREGFLALNISAERSYEQFTVNEDLVQNWYELTGLPFVFLIWATRPGTLDMKQYRAFNDVFHRSLKADQASMRALMPQDENSEVVFYLTPGVVDGLNYCFKEANRQNLLPEMEYQSGTYTLFDKNPKNTLYEKPVHQLLQDIVDGRRIGVRDGIRLAEEASLADLGLAADFLRERVFSERTVSYLYVCDEGHIAHPERLTRELDAALASGIKRLLFLPAARQLDDITCYEDIMYLIKSRFDITIEGFGVPFILRMAKASNWPVEEVVSRLVTAGLECVPPFGGGLLIDRIMTKKHKTACDFTAADWTRTIKWLHRYGAKSSCSMIVSPYESWEERLIHLLKLRQIQDENPGFRYFTTYMSPEWSKSVSVEMKLRATIIGRLFLDNVVAVQEAEILTDRLSSVLTLFFGANEVQFQVRDANQEQIKPALDMLKTLWSLGFDFAPDTFEVLDDPQVH
ncbi:hypothetical protein OAO01_02255 [Oligoflexia bacterium]|nr:hypothetical protein [Oligoflexia bacterium]